jgi:hypothetical protein
MVPNGIMIVHYLSGFLAFHQFRALKGPNVETLFSFFKLAPSK